MSEIKSIKGLEILDSRGRPTVKAYCVLASGARGEASVPSGASTGAAEALELRDGDPRRYQGKGCRRAAAHLTNEINAALVGQAFEAQADFDRALLELDGTPEKSRLGANAILAASVAFSRAQAAETHTPLYQHYAAMLGRPITHFPRMTINLFSGGLHAGNIIPLQDVLIVPASAPTYDEGLVMTQAVYMAAVDLIRRKYNMRWLTADEGGLSPEVRSADELLEAVVLSIEAAGLKPGVDVCIALDVASSHFYSSGQYNLGAQATDASGMIDQIQTWIAAYPIVSIEDGLAEDDWRNWPALRAAIESKVLVLGDDLLCTNPARIRRAIESGACNALLLKVNQIGTLTEAAEAYRLARDAGWSVTISVRSGDTEDNWYSDLAVGWSGDQTKAGSITQSERLTKYNRLLEIESEFQAPMIAWPTPRS